jgi:CheY-like chemotaxis protein
VPSPPPLVLLIDDEQDQVEMYQLGLEGNGFQVVAAYTGGDGVTLARTRQPDVIVLDLRLPDITGWEVCGLLKNDPRTERIPIVILTAAASPTLADDATHAGCAAHLLKPCFPDELIKALRALLGSSGVAIS